MLFTRDVADIAMDVNGVEHIDFNALGGADNITVNDLSGTGVNQVNLDLGANDGAADTVTINGTAGSDVITVTEHDGIITVSGLGQDINITDAGAGDRHRHQRPRWRRCHHGHRACTAASSSLPMAAMATTC